MVSVPAIVPLKMPGLGATGSRKWSVDTKTPVEMHSTTKGCLIFYTLDGTKPDPFKRIGDKTTYQYTKAINLPPGKRTLKAIAILKDGSKESNINTKVFQVTEAIVEEDDKKMNTTWQYQVSDDEEVMETEMDKKLFKKVMRSDEKLPVEKKDPVRKILNGEVGESEKLNNVYGGIKEEEYLMCTYCGEPRPADPYARFCNGCNSILPPAPGRIRSSYGGSFENAMRGSSQRKVECKNCRTLNPTEAQECLVCDSSMNDIPVSKRKKEKAPEPISSFIICPYCTRVNCGNARFCDWCGEKSSSKSRTVTCQRCTAENVVSSQYCCSCGKHLAAPPRESLEKVLEKGDVKIKDAGSSPSSKGQLGLLEKLTNDDSGNWKNIEFESVTRKQSKNVSIQAGDSMISAVEKLSLKDSKKVSPAKGFWRQQVDYVTQHLKIYTQNNIEFREQFSNQPLMTLVSTTLNDVEHEENLKELVLSFSTPEESSSHEKKKKKNMLKTVNSGETLINALKQSSRPSSGRSRPPSAKSLSRQSTQNSNINSPRGSQNGSRPSSGRKLKSKKTLEIEKLDAFYMKLSEDTKKLLNLLKQTKHPDVEEVELLLDSEDIDVSISDENGIPLLKLAVQNQHFDVLLSLILGGVDIDQVSGIKSNTALHEAVLQGMRGKDAVEILLENDASFIVQDKRGKTSYDLAVDAGIDSILNAFNQYTSKGLLSDIMKL